MFAIQKPVHTRLRTSSFVLTKLYTLNAVSIPADEDKIYLLRA